MNYLFLSKCLFLISNTLEGDDRVKYFLNEISQRAIFSTLKKVLLSSLFDIIFK